MDKLQWLSRLLLLFALPPSSSFGPPRLPTSRVRDDLHPVMLLPGHTCSQLEARLTEPYDSPLPLCGLPPACARGTDGGSGYGRTPQLAMQHLPSVACFADQLRLVYDPSVGDYRNVPGVETCVLSFGSTAGFVSKRREPLGPPAAPGLRSREFSVFRRNLTALVEHASGTNGGKPVILVSHSHGGLLALEFLNRSPLAWRRRLVKHYFMASTGAGGIVVSMKGLASKSKDGGDVL
ncbi:hypothetical protein ZWY2020_015805 [Hordeum vulgare]|nr:hypothetical protein ZWY2020_015805 [Hordeum vulgare]